VANHDQGMRENIIQVAKRLFAKQGYDGTSVRQICEEADANVALVSYYFGGKEKLFYQIIQEHLYEIKIEYDHPLDGLKMFLEVFLERRESIPEVVQIFGNEFLMNTERSKKLWEYTVPVWNQLKEILKEGKEAGCFQFYSLEYTLNMIIAVLTFPQFAIELGVYPLKYPLTTEEIKQETIRFILKAIGSEK
jgi:AcrR family transcriptional regulator